MKIGSAQSSNLPPDEVQALTLLVVRARDRTLATVDQMRYDCTARYIPMQRMFNIAVGVYTAGLSEALPGRFHVDPSEIINGRPLGGPHAAVPQARNDALNRLGVGGDARKVIEDPKKILP
jgi:hypothetical protein